MSLKVKELKPNEYSMLSLEDLSDNKDIKLYFLDEKPVPVRILNSIRVIGESMLVMDNEDKTLYIKEYSSYGLALKVLKDLASFIQIAESGVELPTLFGKPKDRNLIKITKVEKFTYTINRDPHIANPYYNKHKITDKDKENFKQVYKIEEQVQYAWSIDGENFYCDYFNSIEECIKSAKEDEHEVWFIYVGKVKWYEPKISATSVLEQLENEIFNEFGEIAEDFEFDNKNIEELENGLNECFQQWLKKTNQKPQFYDVYDVERVYIKE